MVTSLGFVRFMFDEMPVCICVLDSTMIPIAYTFLAKKPYLIQISYIIVEKDPPYLYIETRFCPSIYILIVCRRKALSSQLFVYSIGMELWLFDNRSKKKKNFTLFNIGNLNECTVLLKFHLTIH